MASVYVAINEAVEAALKTVPNAGRIHKYFRYVSDWTKYKELFRQTVRGADQVRSWMISVAPTNSIVADVRTTDAVTRTYSMRLVGVMGLADADGSEYEFIQLAEKVLDAVALVNLNLIPGAVPNSWTAPSCAVLEARQIGSVLCNYCEIAFSVDVEVPFE